MEEYIPTDYTGWVVMDEVQKIPNLLDEVHRLIEERKDLYLEGIAETVCPYTGQHYKLSNKQVTVEEVK